MVYIPQDPYPYLGLDATGIVRAWNDRWQDADISYSGLAVSTQGMVLRQAPDPSTGQMNTESMELYNGYAAGGEHPPTLNVTYSTPGWNMFQGNNRHTGRTQSAISSSPAQQWNVSLPTYSGGAGIGAESLMSSPVAVSDASDSSLPVLYSVVSDLYGNGRIYRIRDDGTSVTTSDVDIPGEFTVTGTPLVLVNGDTDSVYITGNRDADSTAHVYRYDATTTNGVTTWSQVWHRQWAGHIETSPAVYRGSVQYHQGTSAGTSQTVIANKTAIIVAATAANGSPGLPPAQGYMFALDATDGGRLWGYVDPFGEPLLATNSLLSVTTVGGLYPFSPPYYWASTYSSPAVNGESAYANDWSCWVNARNLVDGGFLWQKKPNGDTVQASIFADENGNVFGVGSNQNPNAPGKPLVRWSGPYTVLNQTGYGEGIDNSPLVAGDPGGSGSVFIAANGGYVHILDAANGSLIRKVGPLNGYIYASMAAYKGRLYVLTDGSLADGNPSLYCFH